jgi:putative alpha-1,2-mannosidase
MIFGCFAIIFGSLTCASAGNIKYVNPIIGTDNIYPGNGNYAGMIPTVGSPFAFTRWTPMTYENDVGTCPYFYQDDIFRGFLGTHQPAQWMGESAEIAVCPGTGLVKPTYSERGLKFSHEDEVSSPHYYMSTLSTETGQIIAEATAVSRSCALRFTFKDEEVPYIIIQATRDSIDGEITIDPLNREIYGWNPERQDSVLGPSPAQNFKGYFVAQFDTDFLSWGVANGATLEEDAIHGTGSSLSGYVRLPPRIKANVRVGISYISYDLARESLKREAPLEKNLEEIAEVVKSQWDEKLDLVQITNATDDELAIFYTAMYHALQVR